MESKLQHDRLVFTVRDSVLLIWDNLLYVKDYMIPLIFIKKKSPWGKKQFSKIKQFRAIKSHSST